MRIQSVIPNICVQNYQKIQNINGNQNIYHAPILSDSFSFTGKNINPVKTVREFKQLAIKRGYHCMYCNTLMKYDEAMFNEWKKENLFSLPIKFFVKRFKQYKKCLHSSEKEIFDYVEQVAQNSPDAKLDTVIKIMSVKANKELLKVQQPIFDTMTVEAMRLPDANKNAVLNLIAKSKARMLRIPHKEEFSGKEMRYKIENLSNTLADEKLTKKINSLAELLTIPAIYKETEPVTDKTVVRILKTISPNSKITKINNISQNYSPKRLNSLIIHAIKTEVQNHKRKDIYNLCVNAEKMLKGEPIIAKYTNRSFLYDLKEATEGLESSKIRSQLFELANSLPTSRDNVYAFITKHDQSSPEKIAYDLFTPSELTLEHQQPTSLMGKHILANWAWACKRCNNSRSNKDMGVFYKQFDKKNAQRYWNEIISDANKGYFDYDDVVAMLKIFKQQSKIKIQSKHLKFRLPDNLY